MKKMLTSRIALVLTMVTLAMSLAACGGAKSAMQNTAGTMAVEATAAPAMAMPRMAVSSYSMNAMDEGFAEDAAYGENGLSMGAPVTVQPPASGRKLIRTVHLSVETTAFDQLITSISQSVMDAGGYMESSDISGTSISDSLGHRYAYLTVRVPADRLDSFIALVGEQGNITNKSENTQDVTLQYSDIESRKKSLTIEQDRLWELLAKAESMDAIIALESRLSEIRYELESFESQLRTYDNQVDYSTVSINIDEVKVLTPTTPDTILTRIQKGFSRNLQGVCNGLVNFFIWLLSSLPTLVLLGVILLVILAVLRLIRRGAGRKSGKAAGNMPAGPAPGSTSPDVPSSSQEETAGSSSTHPEKKPRWFHR